jgi:hypothetical protein
METSFLTVRRRQSRTDWGGTDETADGTWNRVMATRAREEGLTPTFGESAEIRPVLPSAPVPTLFRAGTRRA